MRGTTDKWRVLRANAVPEKYVTGNASYRDKFDRFAAIMPCLIGNPIYHWSHLELKRFFGIDELLSSQTADSVWERANSKLKSPDGAARSLISESNVRALCTTDDPVDDLRYRRLLAEDNSFTTKVLPTFRPEIALDILSAGYPAYLQKLGAASGIYVRTLDDVKQALAARVEYFASCGCRLSDHSFGAPDFTVWDEGAAEEAMSKALAGEQLLDYEVAAYQSAIMDFLGGLYADKGFAMQLHIGAIRNLNTQRFRSIGVDIGCDSIGDTIPAASLAALLDRMAVRGKLPRTIPRHAQRSGQRQAHCRSGLLPGRKHGGQNPVRFRLVVQRSFRRYDRPTQEPSQYWRAQPLCRHAHGQPFVPFLIRATNISAACCASWSADGLPPAWRPRITTVSAKSLRISASRISGSISGWNECIILRQLKE